VYPLGRHALGTVSHLNSDLASFRRPVGTKSCRITSQTPAAARRIPAPDTYAACPNRCKGCRAAAIDSNGLSRGHGRQLFGGAFAG